MSAFIVTDHHINVIVTWAADNGVSVRQLSAWADPQTVAQLLYAQNVESVNYRYKLDEPVGQIGYSHTALYRPIDVLKLINSLAYQCTESPEWETSLAKDMLEAIRNKAITKLPGYEAAPWSI